jgi:hypothetical protein
MVQLHKAQSILTVGPTRDADPRDYSILRLDMPHRDNANPDAPHKRLTYAQALRRTTPVPETHQHALLRLGRQEKGLSLRQ